MMPSSICRLGRLRPPKMPGFRLYLMYRSWKGNSSWVWGVLAGWIFSLASCSNSSAQDEAATVERYLSRLGLSELRVRHLEREVEQGSGGEAKQKAAKK